MIDIKLVCTFLSLQEATGKRADISPHKKTRLPKNAGTSAAANDVIKKIKRIFFFYLSLIIINGTVFDLLI